MFLMFLFGTDMRYLVASRPLSLQFRPVSKIVRTVLAFRKSVSLSSHDRSVKSNSARNSFAVWSIWITFRFSVLVICVGSDIPSCRSSSPSSSSVIHGESACVGLWKRHRPQLDNTWSHTQPLTMQHVWPLRRSHFESRIHVLTRLLDMFLDFLAGVFVSLLTVVVTALKRVASPFELFQRFRCCKPDYRIILDVIRAVYVKGRGSAKAPLSCGRRISAGFVLAERRVQDKWERSARAWCHQVMRDVRHCAMKCECESVLNLFLMRLKASNVHICQ